MSEIDDDDINDFELDEEERERTKNCQSLPPRDGHAKEHQIGEIDATSNGEDEDARIFRWE